MAGSYIVLVLFFAVMSISNAANVGRSSDFEYGQKSYENNPFFNSSYAAEQYRRSHYPGHHHHHDYYHNHNDDTNVNNYGFQDRDDTENNFETSERPKVTSRRQIADESIPDYPYSEIRNFLKSNPLFKQYFSGIPKLGNRGSASDDEDGESLCKTQVIRTYHPQKLRNIHEVERFIVNDREEYVQAIEEKKCVNDKGSCSLSFDTFGYTSYCHQNFDVKRLMVFESDSKKAVFDEFRIPSCCVCKIRKNK